MLPVRLIRKKSPTDEFENEFLKEVEYNCDISKEIREVVEYRFRKSKVNSSYKFPRKIESRLDEFIRVKRSNQHSINLKRSTQSSLIKNRLNLNVSLKANQVKVPDRIKKGLSLKFLDSFQQFGSRRKILSFHLS